MSWVSSHEMNDDGNAKNGTSDQPSPDSHERLFASVQKELAPINTVWLWFTGLTTFVLSFLSDIFGPALGSWLPWLVVCLLFAALPLALILVGRDPEKGEAIPVGWIACLSAGAKRSWKLKRYGVLLLAVATFAVYAAYVQVKRGDGGPLRELLVSTLTVEEIARRTEAAVGRVEANTEVLLEKTSRIEQEVSKPLTPREQLAKEGVEWNATTFDEALNNGDVELVRRMLEAGWNALSFQPGDDGHSLGHFFGRVGAHGRAVEMIKVLNEFVDLTQPLIRIGSLEPSRAASIAAKLCNRSMVEALHSAGVNVRIQDGSRATKLGIESDAVEKLKTWTNRSWDFFACSQADRDAILSLIEPAVFQ